jgi:hypothetical protein
MGKNTGPQVPIHPESDKSVRAEQREILIAHDPAGHPLTAVRNVLIQASLAELKTNGHYERYTRLVAPSVLEQLVSSLAPSWVPVELVLAHYEACENLGLSPDEFAEMGKRVGGRVQDAVLVSLAKKVREGDFDLWRAMLPLHRMWPRVFRGGSVQTVKVGPREMVLEEWGFAVNRYHYYRQGHIAALTATYTALGARLTSAKIESYNAPRDELVVRIAWA